jgi:hypothetical protein
MPLGLQVRNICSLVSHPLFWKKQDGATVGQISDFALPRIACLPYESASLERLARRSGPPIEASWQIVKTARRFDSMQRGTHWAHPADLCWIKSVLREVLSLAVVASRKQHRFAASTERTPSNSRDRPGIASSRGEGIRAEGNFACLQARTTKYPTCPSERDDAISGPNGRRNGKGDRTIGGYPGL